MPTSARLRFNFYVLVGAPDEPTVMTVPVTSELQTELSAEFASQLADFNLDGADLVDYASNPQYRPDDGELFEIRGFSLPATIPDLSTAAELDIPAVSSDQIESGALRALVGVPQGLGKRQSLLCFQAVDNRQLLKRSRLSILLSTDVFSKNEKSGLVVRSSLTAVCRSGDLYFPAEPPVRRFLDLSQQFTEATDPQVKKFLGHSIFAVDDQDAIVKFADKWTRKKIAAIEDRGILKNVPLQAVVRAGKQFGLNISTRGRGSERALVVPADKAHFKNLLRLLDQDFLASTITSDRFRANSKLRL